MNLIQIQEELRVKVEQTAAEIFNVEINQIVAEVPPKTEFGDLAFPVAFELVKLINKRLSDQSRRFPEEFGSFINPQINKSSPRDIAEQLKTALEENESVERVEIAGAGYLNVFLNRAKFLAESANAEVLPQLKLSLDETSQKVCIEHTSVNPNKAAHIGHVRNSVLGDTFVRILRADGKRVEVQNYIDNTGVQVADVVVGFYFYKEIKSVEAIKRLDLKGKTFDYYCWDLYAEIGQEYQKRPELLTARTIVLHAIEKQENYDDPEDKVLREIAEYVATRNVQCILATMERFDIRYDLLPRESEILHLHFWAKAFEQMKQRSVIHFVTEGKLAGCWVMPTDSHSGTDEHEADKILVRSNGTVTYTGKDIAYQMWKLGLLGLDFYYNLFHTYADGKEVWVTTTEDLQSENVPAFGNNETVYNVIDSRQSYPQEVVKKGVATIFPEKGAAASVHLSYEMVALSPSAAQELGFEISEEDKQKSFIEMAGRKGLGVKADDLLNRLEENAFTEVEKRHPDLSSEEKRKTAHSIAVGALRYFLLKFTRNTIIVFDFKEALSFEGETGCFCQYSAVRANSIFRKLSEQDLKFQVQDLELEKVSEIFNAEDGNDIWSMAILASRLEETIAQAANANEPAILAKYTFNLAKTFNLFYHNHKIIVEENPAKRAVLIAVADLARRSLTAALNCLGIEVPERM